MSDKVKLREEPAKVDIERKDTDSLDLLLTMQDTDITGYTIDCKFLGVVPTITTPALTPDGQVRIQIANSVMETLPKSGVWYLKLVNGTFTRTLIEGTVKLYAPGK